LKVHILGRLKKAGKSYLHLSPASVFYNSLLSLHHGVEAANRQPSQEEDKI
jgi:hypothetical protein